MNAKIPPSALRTFALVLLGSFLGASCGTLSRLGGPEVHASIASAQAIDPYGSVNLDLPAGDLLKAGFRPGDLVRVSFAGKSLQLPLLPHYRLVAPGEAVLVAWEDAARPARLAVFYGSFAEKHGLAEKSALPGEAPAWRPAGSGAFPLDVGIRLVRHGAYTENLDLLRLRRSNRRADYPALSDAEFANFRAVEAPLLRTGALFRSSSPFQSDLERNAYVDAACRGAGIRTIVDMADSEEDAHAARGFQSSYAAAQNILFRPMGVDFSSPDFGRDLADALRFLSTNAPPCLLHCKEGQDRTGFACAVLECYFGASPEQAAEDYLRTFRNFYGVAPGSSSEKALRATFSRILERAFGLRAPLPADLRPAARAYLLSIGLSTDDLDALDRAFRAPQPL